MSSNREEIARLKEQIELVKLQQKVARQQELQRLTREIQIENEKRKRREEEKLKEDLEKELRNLKIQDLNFKIEEETRKLVEKLEKQREIENLRRANALKKQAREARLKRLKQKKLQQMDKQKKEMELDRQMRRARAELAKQGERQAELEAQYLEAEKRKQRLESLENKVKWYEERLKKEEDPLPLDVTKPNWSSPFPQPLELRKLVINATRGIDLLTADASLLEDLEFVDFSPGSSVLEGSLRSPPFAKGTFRYSYFCQLAGGHYVMKHMIDSYHKPEDELTDLQETAATHFLGKIVVQEWNKRKPSDVPSFEMLDCDVVEWDRRPEFLLPGEATRQYWTIEPILVDIWKKFNNNGNFQDEEHPAAHALSHFSYHISGKKWMFVDVQGSCTPSKDKYTLTDPAFHTETGKGLGGTNMGLEGYKQFFEKHECSDFCRKMGLEPVTL